MNDIKVPPFTDGQKKLIEMTEKLAGSRKICDVDDIDDVKDIKEIISETIAKIENQKQTNFQRITASPESLAEYLSNISTMPVCEIIGYCDKCPLSEKCQEEPLGDGDQYEVWLAWLEQECD